MIEKIDNALSGKEKQGQFTLGAVGETTKLKIENDTNQKLFKERQYSFIVDSDDFIHISKHFDTNEEIADEIIRLLDIVSNYDNIQFKSEGNLCLKKIILMLILEVWKWFQTIETL